MIRDKLISDKEEYIKARDTLEKDYKYILKTELPPVYYMYQGIINYIDYLLDYFNNNDSKIDLLPYDSGNINDKEFLAYYITHNRQKINEIIIKLNELGGKKMNKKIKDKDIPLIPDNELIILKQEKAIDMQKAIDYNFKVLKEKINQVVKVINNENI